MHRFAPREASKGKGKKRVEMKEGGDEVSGKSHKDELSTAQVLGGVKNRKGGTGGAAFKRVNFLRRFGKGGNGGKKTNRKKK